MTSDELLKKGGLFRIKIELTEAFDAKDTMDAEAIEMLTQSDGTPHFVVLRELSGAESIEMQGKAEDEIIEIMKRKLSEVIVDHSFMKSNGDKTPNGDVYKILQLSSNLYTYVIGEWQARSPLARRTREV